ncbi:MAG: ATP-binding cassette domain-containing protein [Pseudomonadota bacterium]
MIELRNVCFRVDQRHLLANLNLQLSERRIAVIGANGSGKSTFARLLNGLLLPSEGEVRVEGLNTHQHGSDVRRLVGFVFQNPDNQMVFPTVAEDLAFGLNNLGMGKAETAQRVDAMLESLGLGGFGERLIHQLSGGEKQLVAIAGVLLMKPQVIVFDEPTTLLDLKNKKRIAQEIAELDQQVILVAHDLDLMANYDRVLCFDQGQLVRDGAPADVITYYSAQCG